VRFSVWPKIRQPWSDLYELASHAEATGWDGVWVSDHFMPAAPPLDVPTLECWSVLAGLARAVPRVRLGPLVTGNTYRHPAVLANMAATTDHLCEGRLVLGIGAGWQTNEHRAYGLPFPSVAERLGRLDEACAVLTALFTQSRTTFQGTYYTLDDAPLDPKPVQQPLPLLIGGGGEKVTLRIAARWAQEWNTWGEPGVLAHKGAVLNSHCEALGRDPATIRRSAQVLVERPGSRMDALPFPTVGGSTEQIRDTIGSYVDAGVDEFILPDWNAGSGTARQEFFDWFMTDIAASLR